MMQTDLEFKARLRSLEESNKTHPERLVDTMAYTDGSANRGFFMSLKEGFGAVRAGLNQVRPAWLTRKVAVE